MWRVLLACLLVALPARAETPPPEFFDQPLYAPSPDRGYEAPVAAGGTVGGFASGLPPGTWERGEGGTWILRAARSDGELVALFQPAQSGTGVLLARGSIGGREIPAGQLRTALLEAPASPPPIPVAPVPAPSAQIRPAAPRPAPLRPETRNAPGGPDLAAMAQGSDADSMLDILPIQQRFRDLMGDDAFAVAQVTAIQGAQPVEESDGLARAIACRPQSCEANQVRFIMDHAGGAWAALTQNGATAYFGDPPAKIRRLLTP